MQAIRGARLRQEQWWIPFALGLACVAFGIVLLADPFSSIPVLAGLVGAGLIVTGLIELVTANNTPRSHLTRITGGIWLAVGVIALVWPSVGLRSLAILVGVGLVLGGAAKLATVIGGDGDERVILGLSGLTSIGLGVAALAWPTATVLVLAVIFGLRMLLFGFGQLALALKVRGSAGGLTLEEGLTRRPHWPRWVRVVGGVTALALAAGALLVSVVVHRAQPSDPGAFYTAPSPLPEGPLGAIIRSEVIEGFHAGSTAYRVLYRSTGYDGKPAAVSGMIVVPDGPAPAAGRKVVAYTHGTVGVASNCAPSLVTNAAQQPLLLEGGGDLLAAGYVLAATDYQGMGTPGPHPYLVGDSEGMNALDSVRAARNLPEARAGTDLVVWGHSQGGHASLFTGQLASSYAPELHLFGVAAGAPAPNLIDLFKVNIKTQVGKILIAMALQSWAQVYDDASLDQIVTPAARPVVAEIAKNCIYNPLQILTSVPAALALDVTFLSNPPWETEPWKTIAARNDPGATRIGAPILIIQGDADPIVAPDVTARFAAKLCANGETVELRVLPGIAHLDAGQVAAPDVARWIADRFAGEPAVSTCA